MADNEKNKDTAPSSEPAEQKKDKVSKPIKDLLGDVVKAQKEGSLGSEEEASDKETEPETKAKKEKKKTNVKQLKHGMMSTVLTIVFIAAVVLVNVIATVLFERYPLTIDLTKEKKYSISTDSQEYIEKIDVDVLVTIFSTEEQFSPTCRQYVVAGGFLFHGREVIFV